MESCYLEYENAKDRDRQKEKKRLRNEVKQYQKNIRKTQKVIPHFSKLVAQQCILIESQLPIQVRLSETLYP